MSYTDEEIIASIRNDVFEATVKCAILAHHRDLKVELMPHLQAVLNAIGGVALNQGER